MNAGVALVTFEHDSDMPSVHRDLDGGPQLLHAQPLVPPIEERYPVAQLLRAPYSSSEPEAFCSKLIGCMTASSRPSYHECGPAEHHHTRKLGRSITTQVLGPLLHARRPSGDAR